jgi:hypothetical protein
MRQHLLLKKMVFLPEGNEAPSGSSASSEVQSGEKIVSGNGSIPFGKSLPKRCIGFEESLFQSG